MKITANSKLFTIAILLGALGYFAGQAAFATGTSNPCKNKWCVNEQNQTQTQQQNQHQTQEQTSTSNSTATGGDSSASIGDTTANGGHGGAGGASNATGGTSSATGGTVANSGNSRSSSNVSDSGNANVVDSGNSQASIQNTIIHRYPITLTPPSVLDGQQGSQIYTELHGVEMVIHRKPVLFISELANSDKAQAITSCGVIGSKSEHGKTKLGALYTSGSQYRSAYETTEKLVKRAPKGTNQIVALVATGYHNRGGALSGGAGEMSASGVTKMLTASLSGGAVFPFPIVRAYYCTNELEAR